MIEFELPCCGFTGRLADLGDAIRCEACGVVVELAPDATAELGEQDLVALPPLAADVAA